MHWHVTRNSDEVATELSRLLFRVLQLAATALPWQETTRGGTPIYCVRGSGAKMTISAPRALFQVTVNCLMVQPYCCVLMGVL